MILKVSIVLIVIHCVMGWKDLVPPFGQGNVTNPHKVGSSPETQAKNTFSFGKSRANRVSQIRYFYCLTSTSPVIKKCNPFLLGHRVDTNATALDWSRTQLVVIVHGLQDPASVSPDLELEWNLATEIVLRAPRQGMYTIILMEWKSISFFDAHHYDLAAEGAVIAATDLMEFVADLKNKSYIYNFHQQVIFIGIGIGGHVAGMAGRKLKNLDQGQVHSIYAVDPSGPLFSSPWGNFGVAYAFAHISKTDASHVNIWHCSMRSFGSRKESGHTDLFLYGGWVQPGCPSEDDCSHKKCLTHFVRFVMHSVRVCPKQTGKKDPLQTSEESRVKLRVKNDKCKKNQIQQEQRPMANRSVLC